MATKIFGLVGYPLGHSFSKKYFNEKFADENIDAEYKNFEIEDINEVTDIINHNDIFGLNVTIPHKISVIPLLSQIDPIAEAIGSVNVIKIIRTDNGIITRGYNTDAIGFTTSIKPLIQPHHRHALVLGTGGASKAVVYALQQLLGIDVQSVSRNPAPGIITYADLDSKIMESHTVVVNATPLGMYPHVETHPDIPYRLLSPQHLCFDLTYNPSVTTFMRMSSEFGAKTCNGKGMLIGQALAAWDIWNE
ncbi:MAG: shikimate dehydrogenase [Muribaculaceae bacterium]|nr:shikimate dehydrogenase [Muribaculaceae bacterium]